MCICEDTGRYVVYFLLIYFRVHVTFCGTKWVSRNVALLATTVEITTARSATLVQAAVAP